VVRRADAHLRPFPAEVGDEIRLRGSPATALHCRTDSFVSRQCCGEIDSAWSVMLQKSRPEQKRAKSQASAAVSALALEHRQAPDEGVGREGRVDVQVTEEDLLPAACAGARLGPRRPGREPASGPAYRAPRDARDSRR